MKYKDLKQYFIDNQESLPKTLGNDFMFIRDVKSYVEHVIELIENQIRLHGKRCNEIFYARAVLNELETVYKLMQNKENHNVKGIKRPKNWQFTVHKVILPIIIKMFKNRK